MTGRVREFVRAHRWDGVLPTGRVLLLWLAVAVLIAALLQGGGLAGVAQTVTVWAVAAWFVGRVVRGRSESRHR